MKLTYWTYVWDIIGLYRKNFTEYILAVILHNNIKMHGLQIARDRDRKYVRYMH